MRAVFVSVVGMTFVCRNFFKFDMLISFSNGENHDGRVGKSKSLFYLFGIESSDNQSVIAQFNGFQLHTLRCDADIHVQHLAFGNGGTDNDERSWLGSRKRQVQFGKHPAQLDVFQDDVVAVAFCH